MNYSTYRFTLDIHQTRSQVSIPVMFQDTWVQLFINLTDGGKPYKIEEGCKAILFGKKADGTSLVNDCGIIDNTRIVYTFNDQTASCIGSVGCEVRLYSRDGLKLTTPSFVILVEEQVVKDDEIIESEDERSALTRVFETEAAREEAETERKEAETERKEAEAERKEAEAERKEAEAERKEAFDVLTKIPPVTEEDEGKFLRVEGGKWSAVEVTDMGGSGETIPVYDDSVTVDESATPTFTDDYSEGYTDGYKEGSKSGGASGGASGGTSVTIDGEVQETFHADTYIAERINEAIGDISTALDEVLALQEYYTGATFDDLHAYATNIKNGGDE